MPLPLHDEPGCLRFDVHQHTDDPHSFVLYEIYTSQAAFEVDHRQAPHYAAWRRVAADCVDPGSHVNTFCTPAFPADIPENTSRKDRSRNDRLESGQRE